MLNLIRFFVRYHFILLFLFLEIIAFSIVVTSHNEKKQRFLNSANPVMGFFFDGVDNIIGYYNLKSANENLAESNAKLLNASVHAYRLDTALFHVHRDSVLRQQYEYIAANVIKNTTHRHRNFFTIDKGRSNGVEKDMAVIAPNGAVGIVSSVSDHYALVISLLNVDTGISSKMKGTGYFGSVSWDGRDVRKAQMNGIPSHATLQKGDSIVTSGYSAIFPEGIMVGRLQNYKQRSGTNFHIIELGLSVDFAKLKQVFVVKNLLREEQKALEEEVE